MNSNFFNLNWKDFGKGLLVSVISAVLTVVAATINAGSLTFDWKTIGQIAATTGIAYIVKNLFQNSQGNVGTEPKP